LTEEQQWEIQTAVAEKKCLNELSQCLLELEKRLKKRGDLRSDGLIILAM
jgi:hypothetical protein